MKFNFESYNKTGLDQLKRLKFEKQYLEKNTFKTQLVYMIRLDSAKKLILPLMIFSIKPIKLVMFA